MAKILSLDTATKVCSVAIHEDGELVGAQTYHLQKSHSNLLPGIIQELAANCELTVRDLEAIAISAGPGSYTGLRIGTATAKGLAYTLGLPLIAVDSLDSMIIQVKQLQGNEQTLLCPMIDARRMEVYCKLVESDGTEIWPTSPLIVDEDTFSDFTDRQIFLFGNGSGKLKSLFSKGQFHFIEDIHPKAEFMGQIARQKFDEKKFEDVAYFEPEYLKEYRTNIPSQKFKV